MGRSHFGGLLFVTGTARLHPKNISRGEAGGFEKPGGKDRVSPQVRRPPCQGYEHDLGHILGRRRVADLSQGDGIDEIHVPPDQFGKRLVRPGPHVLA